MAAVGTVTISEERNLELSKITWNWTSDASGNASGKLTVSKHTGLLSRFVTVPGTAGDAPTDNYDMVINDEDGTDILMGAGANRDTAVTEQVLASSLGAVVGDVLELQVSNAGNAKKGKVYLYLHR